MRLRRLDGFAAAAVAVVMMATAAGASWLVVTSGVLSPPVAAGDRPVAAAAQQQAPPADDSVKVNGSFQLSQPRDPFRPLITESSPPGSIPGVGGTPGTPGNGNGDGDGNGFEPGKTITLEAINEVGGELVATIVVNGVTYQVGEGDTFAGSFKVIELTEDTALIQYGDIVFELKVGLVPRLDGSYPGLASLPCCAS
jgi:hypothetical protein